jgi:extracellular matrix regulatory protein A
LETLNIGYGNVVPASRIVVILQPGSSPVKRLREEAAKAGRLLDATQGRKTRSILVLDSNHVILSAVQAQTLTARLAGELPDEQERGEGR